MNLPNLAPVPFVAPRIREDGPVRSHLLALKAAAIREELEPTQEHLIGRGLSVLSAPVPVNNDCIILATPAFGENSFRAPPDA